MDFFNIERICGIILIFITGVVAFQFQKRYFSERDNPLIGFTIMRSRYRNILFSWILAGVGISIYLFAGFFEGRLSQYWNFEITPIIILAGAFLLGPFYGFLIGVIGNTISLLLSPGITAGSIQFLLTWIRGFTALWPLAIMAIFINRKKQMWRNLLVVITAVFIAALWSFNLLLVLNSPFQLSPTYWNVIIISMAFISAVLFLFCVWLAALWWQKQQQKKLAKWRTIGQIHLRLNQFTNKAQQQKRTKEQNEKGEQRWRRMCLWYALITMTLFYIFVYYLLGGLVVGTQIFHISYYAYILWQTPSWLLSWVIAVIVLNRILVFTSMSKRYDFIIIKIKKRFLIVNEGQNN